MSIHCQKSNEIWQISISVISKSDIFYSTRPIYSFLMSIDIFLKSKIRTTPIETILGLVFICWSIWLLFIWLVEGIFRISTFAPFVLQIDLKCALFFLSWLFYFLMSSKIEPTFSVGTTIIIAWLGGRGNEDEVDLNE